MGHGRYRHHLVRLGTTALVAAPLYYRSCLGQARVKLGTWLLRYLKHLIRQQARALL